jgi:hypothetical protein
MREKLQDAPWWVWSLIEGVFFGSFMAVYFHAQGSGGWSGAIVGGLISGAAFGAVMGPFAARQRRTTLAAAGSLPARDLPVAGRAAMRGPVPHDPDVRQAAERLATQQLNEFSRFRWLGLSVFAAFTLLSTFLALTSSPSWWAATALFAVFEGLYLLLPLHLRRRVALLKEATDE